MNVFEFVVAIVLIATIGKIIRARYAAQGQRPMAEDTDLLGLRIRSPLFDAGMRPADDGEAQRLRDEVRTLKDRIAVLERLATEDDSSASRLDREIEKLRDKG